MPKSHRPPEFRKRIVGLVRKGRTPEELGRQFEPSAQAIRNWVKQAALDAGQRADGLTTAWFATQCRASPPAVPWDRSVTRTTTRCARDFFATLECERLDRQRFRTQADAHLAIFDFTGGRYNPRRHHSVAPASVADDFRADVQEGRSHSGLRIDDRRRGCSLPIPLGAGAVMLSKAVHRPPNRGNSMVGVPLPPLRNQG
jgi:transposase-like protein